MRHWWLPLYCLASVVQAEECGTVSVFFEGPETASIYEARIGEVNGESTLLDKMQYRLAPGSYEFKVYELIDAPELRVDVRHRGYGKALKIDVQKDKVYHVGAKFNHRDPFDRQNFWEPVVWKVSDSPCEL